jgi:hypothetical protein
MRYWWVNQNRTYQHEVTGGYLWSPKRKSNGAVNPFYESMREVTPGDIVLSFADTRILRRSAHCMQIADQALSGLVQILGCHRYQRHASEFPTEYVR